MGRKSKFIDRKRDVLHTFKVVARSQQDPLAADESAPQAVLQSTQENESKEEEQKFGVYFDDDYNYLQHLRGTKEAVDWDTPDLEVYTIRKEDSQANKKELRDRNKLVLPSSAFESFVEEPIGLLNKAAPLTGPRPELDPDIVAALDDDCDAVNPEDEAFPDNFVSLLNADEAISEEDDEWEDANEDQEIWGNYKETEFESIPCSSYTPNLNKYRSKTDYVSNEDEEQDFSSDFNDSDDEDEARDILGQFSETVPNFKDEETKSHFTNYSLTSSVLRRNEGLSTLDDCFEGKFLREYDDFQVGALDGEDIDGYINEDSPHFAQVMERHRKQMEKMNGENDDKDRIVRWIKDMEIKQDSLNNKEEVIDILVEDNEPGEKWDCESILSTYSTLYNHPCTITDAPKRKKIDINPNTGIPREFNNRSLTLKALKEHESDMNGVKELAHDLDTRTLRTSMSAVSVRLPGETSEERKERKKALKELRRERRIEKKLNRTAFKEEKKKQEKNNMNNRVTSRIVIV